MLEFRPEHFDALGEGIFVPDGDSLYITNGHWLLVITGCEHHIPIDILRIIANAGESRVDWRILGAREIYEKENKYLPYRGPQSLDIYVSRYISKYATVDEKSIRGLLEKNSEPLWGDNYRLDQLFSAGKARTHYKKEEQTERRKFSTESTADYYLFDLDRRLLTVGAEYFRCFYDLGFNITCPVRSSGPPPVLGLYLRDTVPDIFGYLCPTRGTNIKVSDDGRPLLIDPAEISWYSVEEGIQKLCDPWNYEPGYVRQVVESGPTTEKKILTGLSILRWHGIPEDQIEEIYRDGRIPGLEEQLPEQISNLRRAINDSHGNNTWAERRLAAAVETLRELQHELRCELPEDLIPFMGL